MVRATQLLHPQREPAATRPAATVLLLRGGAGGVEVLMTRRSPTASFAPGAYVFPGGGIDPEEVVTPGIFVDAIVTVPDPAQEEDLNRANAHHPKVTA